MGVAAYNRGTQLIRNQTAAQIEESRPAIERRAERQMIRELEQRLDDTREQSGVDLARALKTIRRLREKLDNTRDQSKFWQLQAARFMKAFNAARESWQKASELLRMLSPSDVQRLRDLRDMHN